MTADESTWEGYRKIDFEVDGRACFLVLPRSAATGKPWIWRTEFFGHEPQADLALLGRGFHAAYIDMQNMYGAPVAMDHMDAFFGHVTREHGLSSRVVLEGFSRGGLFAFNWAARRPANTACIYGDAPVCDIRSWPAGMGKGPGSPEDWKRCVAMYGLKSKQDAARFRGNPIDNLEPLAKAKVPVLMICGDADKPVPFEENAAILAERYRALGGPVTMIVKPGVDHHPHSLVDPTPIVDFILDAVAGRGS
ncbi:MAG: alpha/beta hydrolase [Planctomycetes bacterium]|nr:alpha/beta hydrolase [Planctomycetota bacterium]